MKPDREYAKYMFDNMTIAGGKDEKIDLLLSILRSAYTGGYKDAYKEITEREKRNNDV